MARTKQTAHKSDPKSGKLTQATFDEPNSTSTMDKPAISQAPQDQPDINQPDIDPTDQPPAAQVPGDAPVDPGAAAQGEEEIVEVEHKAAGEAEETAHPSTSQPTHKCKVTDDNSDEESRAYKAASHASAAEVWTESVIKATTDNKARQAYDTMYEALYKQVLPKQPGFTCANKTNVLNSILKLDGMYVTDDNAEMWYTERLGEEPGKTAVNRDQEKQDKETVVKVHDAVLQAWDSLKVIHQSLYELGKVVPLDLYLKVVREQQIPM